MRSVFKFYKVKRLPPRTPVTAPSAKENDVKEISSVSSNELDGPQTPTRDNQDKKEESLTDKK